MAFRYYKGSNDYIAQTQPLIIKDPPERFKKFIKLKDKHDKKKVVDNGIDNDGFSDYPLLQLPIESCESQIHSLLKAKKTSTSLEELHSGATGVKKKATNGLTRSESASGTKKKIRTAKSPNKDYYQIWTASSSSPEEIEDAPPLPPRSLHRPLKRSNAVKGSCSNPEVPGFKPPVLRQNKPKRPEDTFQFDLIDTDEPPCYESQSQEKSNTPEKHIDVDNYISAKCVTGQKHSLDGRESTSSMSTASSTEFLNSHSPDTNMAAVKPHKKLSRQLSPEGMQPHIRLALDETVLEVPRTPLHQTTTVAPSPPSLKPHNKILARISG